MTKILRIPILAFLFLVALTAPAFADNGASGTTGSLAVMGVLSACAFLSWVARAVAPQGNFFHTGAGAIVLAVASLTLSAVTSAVTANGLNGPAIGQAVLAALISFFASANPSVPAGTTPPKAMPKAGFALIALFTLPTFLTACAHVPPNVQAYDASLTACLEAQGITAAVPEGQQILQILETGGGTAQQIETSIESALISAGGAGAVIVANCAVQAWFDQHPVGPGKSITPSQAAARIYLANHGPRTTLHAATVESPSPVYAIGGWAELQRQQRERESNGHDLGVQ